MYLGKLYIIPTIYLAITVSFNSREAMWIYANGDEKFTKQYT